MPFTPTESAALGNWLHLSALGGLEVTAPAALIVAAWLASARRWRLALDWCLLFGCVLAVAAGSQIVFIGWGVGIAALDFTGFSGHAARAAVVFPVVLFLLFEKETVRVQWTAVLAGSLLAAGVAVARVMIGAHSPSEAVAGYLLGVAAAAIFVTRARTAPREALQPLLLYLFIAAIALPKPGPVNSHQWLTAAALKLSGRHHPARLKTNPTIKPEPPAWPAPASRYTTAMN